MKKLLKVLLVVFVVSVLAATLIACKKDPCKDGHDWDQGTVTTQATCLGEGEKTLTCLTCGETKTETIDALGHDWSEWGDTTATCTEGGKEFRTCERDGCNSNAGQPAKEERNVDALGHEYVDNKCVRFDDCGEELTPEQVVAALNGLEKPAEPAYGTSIALYKGTFKLTGTITKIVYDYNAGKGTITVNINVNGTTIQAYGMKAAEGVQGIETLCVGDTIEVSGALKQYYNNNWIAEFDTGCLLKSVTKVQRSITWTYDNTVATVVLATDESAPLPTTVDGGTSVSFKITPASGKQVLSVTANGSVVEAIENGAHEMIYTVAVREDTEIEIAVGREGMPVPTKLVSLTFPDDNSENNKVSSYVNSWEAKIGTRTWDITNFNNNKGGWDYIKAFNKNTQNATSTISVTLAEEITSVVVKASAIDNCTATIKLEVIKDGSVIYTVESAVIPANAGNITLAVKSFEANCQYKLTVSGSNSSSTNGGVWVYSISYYAITCSHQWSTPATPVTPSTCAKPGTQSQVCSVCENTKISPAPLSDQHTWTAPVKEATSAGADELGNAAYYFCTVCNHYFTQGEGTAWIDLGEDADVALATVRIHKDDHELKPYTQSETAGKHNVECNVCGYKTLETCNTNGEDGACSKCNYKNENANYVDVTVSYVVGSAEATSEVPANLELIWKDSEKLTIQDAVAQLECGKTYYLALNLNDKYTLGTVKIGGTEVTADEGNYTVEVAAEATDAIEIVISVNVIPQAKYVKVTSLADITSGAQYIIGYEDTDAGEVYAMGITDAEGNYVKVAVSSGTIAKQENTFANYYTITVDEDGYQLKSSDNKYLYSNNTSSNKFLLATDSSADTRCTIAISDTGLATITSGRVLLYNSSSASGNDRYRFYSANSATTDNSGAYKLPCLYKLVEA